MFSCVVKTDDLEATAKELDTGLCRLLLKALAVLRHGALAPSQALPQAKVRTCTHTVPTW